MTGQLRDSLALGMKMRNTYNSYNSSKCKDGCSDFRTKNRWGHPAGLLIFQPKGRVRVLGLGWKIQPDGPIDSQSLSPMKVQVSFLAKYNIRSDTFFKSVAVVYKPCKVLCSSSNIPIPGVEKSGFHTFLLLHVRL